MSIIHVRTSAGRMNTWATFTAHDELSFSPCVIQGRWLYGRFRHRNDSSIGPYPPEIRSDGVKHTHVAKDDDGKRNSITQCPCKNPVDVLVDARLPKDATKDILNVAIDNRDLLPVKYGWQTQQYAGCPKSRYNLKILNNVSYGIDGQTDKQTNRWVVW